jgi:hypothetical protein
VARGAAHCASQVIGRGVPAIARGAAHCASQVLEGSAKPSPAAPLGDRRRCLIVAPRPLPRCASQVLDRGAQADARGAAQVLDRGAQAVARGAARRAS